MIKEAKTFVQRAVEEAQQEALDGVIEGSLSLLGDVPWDFRITVENIQAAEENLREAVRLSFDVTDEAEVTQKIQRMKRSHRNRVGPTGK